MLDPTPADAARPDRSDEMPIEPRDRIAILLDEISGYGGHWTDLRTEAEDFIAALRAAGFEIVQRGDGVRVPLELAKQIRHSWTIFQPGFILHDQFSELVDAAIAAGADPITPPDCEDSATPATRT